MMEKPWLAAISWKFYQASQQLVNMKNEVQNMYLAMEPWLNSLENDLDTFEVFKVGRK